MKPRPFAHDDLLCEGCGYVLSGLRETDHCPECGKAVVESLPAARSGTAWQRDRAAWPAVVEVLSHPGRTFSIASAEVERSRAFKHLCLAATGLATAFVLVGIYFLQGMVFADVSWQDAPITLMVLIANAGLFGMPVTLLLGLATAIEKRGIMAFGRVHGRRIDGRVAETIVGHASAAWLMVPVLIAVAWVIGAVVGAIAREWRPATWELTLTAPYWMPAVGAFAGMFWFESVVWAGVRQMRFANPESAADRVVGRSGASRDGLLP